MVSLKKCNIMQLQTEIANKECYCFGSGDQAELFFVKHEELLDYVKGFIDNDEKKAGCLKKFLGREIPIYSFKQLENMRNQNTVVITTSMYWMQMIDQMDMSIKLNQLPCYVDIIIESQKNADDTFVLKNNGTAQIPKVIHYCWFGKGEMPQAFRKNIATWKKYCRDYEIVQWDESNYDISKCSYMVHAYQARKWAFVSDYARLDILNQYGGIYLDTDVEMLKPFDIFLGNRMFFGFEQNQCIGSGLGCGSVKKQKLLQDMMQLYHDNVEEEDIPKTAYAPLFQTMIMKKMGFCLDGTYQKRNGIALYPSEVFSPKNLWSEEVVLTEKTYTIHHYSSTWWNKQAADNIDQMRIKLQSYLNRMEKEA